mgnify:FL=1
MAQGVDARRVGRANSMKMGFGSMPYEPDRIESGSSPSSSVCDIAEDDIRRIETTAAVDAATWINARTC